MILISDYTEDKIHEIAVQYMCLYKVHSTHSKLKCEKF